MALSRPDLWERLESFVIGDPAAALSFQQRLARENGWDEIYAARVLDEYRRFLYLMATHEAPMTPSDEVDQAWHLHLAYSESYWNDLCSDLLGTALHHGPTRGGRLEGLRYDRQYQDTLDAYRAEFDTKPPTDIWPSSSKRFGSRYASPVRMFPSRHYAVWRLFGPVLAVIAFGALVTAAYLYFSETNRNVGLALFGLCGGIALSGLLFNAMLVERLNRRPTGSSKSPRRRRSGAGFASGYGDAGCGSADCHGGDSSGCGSGGCGGGGCGGGCGGCGS
ncbi:MAG: hypothetical protein KDN19_10860 [Verrucomicrobiae bacterium]|nr:hypothetical protein [Verrucomicrobiae bacterium]